jgi:hypothetical protein
VIVKQIWTGNAYRNFNYLIACPESGGGGFANRMAAMARSSRRWSSCPTTCFRNSET